MKKILSLVLTAVMTIGVMQLLVVAEDEKTSRFIIADLNNLGIMQGYHDGTFGEDNYITRAEMAKVIVETAGTTEDTTGNILVIEREVTNTFTDVETNHWAYGYIEMASHLKIINGYEDGTFLPDENITYGEVIKLIVCTLGYEPMAESIGGYPQGYITTAMNMGLVRNVGSMAGKPITRGEVAELIYTALYSPIMVRRVVNDDVTYVIMDGKNDTPLKTLRMQRCRGRIVIDVNLDFVGKLCNEGMFPFNFKWLDYREEQLEDGSTLHFWSSWSNENESFIHKIEMIEKDGILLHFGYKNYYYDIKLLETPLTIAQGTEMVKKFAKEFVSTEELEWENKPAYFSIYDPEHVESWLATGENGNEYLVMVDLDGGYVIRFSSDYR